MSYRISRQNIKTGFPLLLLCSPLSLTLPKANQSSSPSHPVHHAQRDRHSEGQYQASCHNYCPLHRDQALKLPHCLNENIDRPENLFSYLCPFVRYSQTMVSVYPGFAEQSLHDFLIVSRYPVHVLTEVSLSHTFHV